MLRFIVVAYIDKFGLLGIVFRFIFVSVVPDPIILPITLNDDSHWFIRIPNYNTNNE